MLHRRPLLTVLSAAALPVAARAQESFPERALRLIIPYPPGGSTDILGRLVGQRLSDALGRPVMIDNRAGAAGAIGTTEAARAAADGYTLSVQIVTTAVINPLTQPGQGPDLLTTLQPVALVAKLPNVMIINKDLPVQDLRGFIAWARANPLRANYGTGGEGSVMHLTGELLKQQAGFDMTHAPYRGAAPAILDLVAGNIAAVFDNITGVMGYVRSGAVRAIGITTGERIAALPDVPTLAEAGLVGFDNSSWLGIWTRRGVPASVLAKLEAAMTAANSRPDLLKAEHELGAVPAPMGSAETERFWRGEFDYWRNAIAVAGIRLG